MRAPPLLSRSSNKAAALIIVLAFVVLLTGLALAYFSSTTTDRQLAQSSYNDTSADLLARSALDIVVGDFKQEMVNGSTGCPQISGALIPCSTPYVVPQRNIPTPIPNLIRISVNGDPGITAPAVGSRASAVNSTNNPSANGRSISTTRWNKHCLMPAGNPSIATIDNPSPTPSFTPPDWVIVTRAGPTPFDAWDATLADPASSNYAIGRYAYAVYDEGGLIDINVTAYPTPAATPILEFVHDIGRKAVPAWTDLTAIVPTPTPTPWVIGTWTLQPWLAKLVGFKNYATTGQSNVSNLEFRGANGAPFLNSSVYTFMNYFFGGYIDPNTGQRTAPAIGFGPPGRDFIAVNPISAQDGRTDQSFITRAELIRFFSSTNILAPATSLGILQYLGTFSREQNKPTLPLTPAWTFTRVVLPQRFYLGNLNEVVSSGNAANIRQHFGLQLAAVVPSGSGPCDSQVRWKYVGQSGIVPLSDIPPFPPDLTALDFFQYIHYALFGNLDPDPTQTHFPYTLGIGAALIDQYDTDALNTGIYYGAGAATCDPAIPACLVYGPEQPGSTVSYQPPTCILPLPPNPDPLPSSPYGRPEINSPTRSVGEFGWAYSILNAAPANNRNSGTTPRFLIDFKDAYNSTSNPDPALLDFFTYNSAPVRAGMVSLNTRQAPVLAAILKGSCYGGQSFFLTGSQSQTQVVNAANSIVTATTTQPAMSRADIARFASVVTSAPFNTTNQDAKDTFARAFSELTQTRTWGLLIDVVAQTGHYKPNATNLQTDFVVEGEKRYWLHVAIDRFDGTIVGQQLEEVTE